MELKVKSFNQHLMNIKAYIQSLTHPNVNNYKDWNIDEMCQWISLLENGRFKQYVKILRD